MQATRSVPPEEPRLSIHDEACLLVWQGDDTLHWRSVHPSRILAPKLLCTRGEVVARALTQRRMGNEMAAPLEEMVAATAIHRGAISQQRLDHLLRERLRKRWWLVGLLPLPTSSCLLLHFT